MRGFLPACTYFIREVLYGINAGHAIKHGIQPPPPPAQRHRTATPKPARTRAIADHASPSTFSAVVAR